MALVTGDFIHDYGNRLNHVLRMNYLLGLAVFLLKSPYFLGRKPERLSTPLPLSKEETPRKMPLYFSCSKIGNFCGFSALYTTFLHLLSNYLTTLAELLYDWAWNTLNFKTMPCWFYPKVNLSKFKS